MAAKFGLFVDEDHSKLPTLYWLPKLHKRPYKSRFVAYSSACTTTELSILLTSCLTAIKNHVIKYCTTVYERNGKNLFWSIKNSGEILNKLKSRGFCLKTVKILLSPLWLHSVSSKQIPQSTNRYNSMLPYLFMFHL